MAKGVPVPSQATAPPSRRGLSDYGRIFGLVWGVLLIAAALCPVLLPEPQAGHWQLYWPNFQLLDDPSVPGSVKLLMLLPLIGGIATVVVSQVLRDLARPLVILGVALFMWLALVSSQVWDAKVLVSTIAPSLGTFLDYLILVVICLAGLFVGFRLQEAYPGGLPGRLTAGISGALLLLALVLPLLPEIIGSLPLAQPFVVMGRHVGLGIISLINLLFLLALGIIGCITFQKAAASIQTLSRTARWILLGGGILLPFLYFEIMFAEIHAAGGPGGVACFLGLPLIWAFKTETWLFGMVALLVVGVIDLVPQVLKRRRRLPQQPSAITRQPASAPSNISVRDDTSARPTMPTGSPSGQGQPFSSGESSIQEELATKLRTLKQLHADGLITAEELAIRQKALLDEMTE